MRGWLRCRRGGRCESAAGLFRRPRWRAPKARVAECVRDCLAYGRRLFNAFMRDGLAADVTTSLLARASSPSSTSWCAPAGPPRRSAVQHRRRTRTYVGDPREVGVAARRDARMHSARQAKARRARPFVRSALPRRVPRSGARLPTLAHARASRALVRHLQLRATARLPRLPETESLENSLAARRRLSRGLQRVVGGEKQRAPRVRAATK